MTFSCDSWVYCVESWTPTLTPCVALFLQSLFPLYCPTERSDFVLLPRPLFRFDANITFIDSTANRMLIGATSSGEASPFPLFLLFGCVSVLETSPCRALLGPGTTHQPPDFVFLRELLLSSLLPYRPFYLPWCPISTPSSRPRLISSLNTLGSTVVKSMPVSHSLDCEHLDSWLGSEHRLIAMRLVFYSSPDPCHSGCHNLGGTDADDLPRLPDPDYADGPLRQFH